MTLEIEEELKRFELGESAYVKKVLPLDADKLNMLAPEFIAHFESSGDLRYLNAVLKILDRKKFKQKYPNHYGRLNTWGNAQLNLLKKKRGLK